MKRILASILMVSLSVPTFASSTTDQHVVIVQNNETTDSFALNTQTTRTEYRAETVREICYRQVITGHRRECEDEFAGLNQMIGTVSVNNVGPHPAPGRHPDDPGRVSKEPRQEPRPVPRPYPRPKPRRPVCHDEPIYTSVAYSCSTTVSVPYEVFDHQSVANINVKMTEAPTSKPQSAICGINFNLTGDVLTAANTCTDYLAVANPTLEDHGYVKNYNYAIKLFDAQSVLSPLAGNLQAMHIEGDDLVVKTGNLANATNFNLRLSVIRKRFFKRNDLLIDRALSPKEFSYQAIDDRTGYVHINFNKIAVELKSSKKYVIKLSLDVNFDSGSMVNIGLPSLHQESSITIKK